MKRILFAFLFTIVLVGAMAQEALDLQMRIIENLSHLLLRHEPAPRVYLGPSIELPEDRSGLTIVPVRDCMKAQILFVRQIDDSIASCLADGRRLLFTLSYREYLRHRDRAVGAFFWQKGRPNIILNGELLERLGVEIPRKYEKYVE
ncbi:hypothetical protein [Hydrogenimonas sp.]